MVYAEHKFRHLFPLANILLAPPLFGTLTVLVRLIGSLVIPTLRCAVAESLACVALEMAAIIYIMIARSLRDWQVR